MRKIIYTACALLCGAVALCGCGKGDGVSGNNELVAQSVKVDAASALGDVLGSGPIATPDGKTVTVDGYLIGQLSLPSGRIVAADGFIMFDAKPFSRTVKPGAYPVTVAVAQLGGDQRIAFAQIRFLDRRISKWEMAVTDGQDPSKLKEDEIYAYGVDSGTGSFADIGAQEVLSARDARKLVDDVMKEMKKVYEPTRDWVVVNTPKGSAVLFSSGWGDGGYASYFGLDDNGEPVVLVTDFQVIDWKRR